MAGLIDFIPPSGFAFRFDTSPSPVLSKSISLRLPTRAFGIGFIHQSPVTQNNAVNRSFFFGPYFMYGKVSVSEGGTIEAYYSQKISSKGHFSLSSLFDNCNESLGRNLASSSQSRTHFQWDFGRVSLASSYCTFGKILGLQFLLNSTESSVPNNNDDNSNNNSNYENKLNFGGEVYYTAQEGSGGVSLGMRLTRKCKLVSERDCPMIFTLTGNPLMGHYRSTLTSPFISPNISVSTRFDVNVNSFDSDLAVGIAYRDSSPLSQGIRCALGLKSGFVFDIQTNVTDNIKIRFGLKTGPFGFKLADNNNGVLLKSYSAGSFGLDVAICN